MTDRRKRAEEYAQKVYDNFDEWGKTCDARDCERYLVNAIADALIKYTDVIHVIPSDAKISVSHEPGRIEALPEVLGEDEARKQMEADTSVHDADTADAFMSCYRWMAGRLRGELNDSAAFTL